jgi:hypothetical protein
MFTRATFRKDNPKDEKLNRSNRGQSQFFGKLDIGMCVRSKRKVWGRVNGRLQAPHHGVFCFKNLEEARGRKREQATKKKRKEKGEGGRAPGGRGEHLRPSHLGHLLVSDDHLRTPAVADDAAARPPVKRTTQNHPRAHASLPSTG